FHSGSDADIVNAGDAEQRPNAAPVGSPLIVLPVTYSAIARRSGPLSFAPCTRITPRNESMMACGDRCFITSGAGARLFSAPLWHAAHCCLKSFSPSGDWALTT